MSADGKIASVAPGPSRFTSPDDRSHMDVVRHDADAILIGGTTLRHANPNLTVRDPRAVAARLASGRVAQPRAVLVTASGEVDATARMFQPPGQAAAHGGLLGPPLPLILTTTGQTDALRERLGDRAEVVGLCAGRLEAKDILAALGQRSIHRLLVEGGGEVLWTFVAHHALDALHLTLAPCLLGGAQAPTVLGGTGFSVPDALRLRLEASRVVGDELFVSYSVRHGGGPQGRAPCGPSPSHAAHSPIDGKDA